MRKYYRAGLAIIASISLVALLFYRHEYNRLRYVLEVFDYFGTDKSNNGNCSGILLLSSVSKLYESGEYADNHNDENLNEPIPSWQRLTDSIYIYSAYRVNNERKIRAIALAKPNRLNLMLSCDIFYENEIEPIVGEFTYHSITDDSSSTALLLPANITDKSGGRSIYRGYHFICDYTINSGSTQEGKPVGLVKFSTNYQSNSNRNNNESVAMIMIPVKEGRNRVYKDNATVGICVASPPFIQRPIIGRDIINFISYHSSLGVENFIVYDFGIPPRFNDILKRITKEQGKRRYEHLYSNNFTYTTVPWNFPLSTKIAPDIVRSIIQADCLYRMYEKVGIIATLTWNEYIILKYHRTIGKLFRDFDNTGFVANRYKVSLVNLCVDETNQRSPNASAEPILFRKKNLFRNNNNYIYIHWRQRIFDNGKRIPMEDDTVRMETQSRRDATSDLIVVNRYEQCDRTDGLEFIPLDDRYVGKFSKIIQNSTITNLFLLHAH